MYRSQRVDRGRTLSDDNEDFYPIPGLHYTDEELAASLEHRMPSRPNLVPGEPSATEPAHAAQPRRGRARSPTSIGDRSRSRFTSAFHAGRSPTTPPRILDPGRSSPAMAVVTRRPRSREILPFQGNSTGIRPIYIPRSASGSSHYRAQYPHESDSELYAESDSDFQDIISSLAMTIEQNPKDTEKWELPPGG
jgi:hypothetical protein